MEIEIGRQKRKSYRARVSWRVVLEYESRTFETSTRNISAEGVHLRLPAALDQGTPVRVQIFPPDREPIDAEAEVIWAYPSGEDSPVLGLRFTGLRQEDLAFLKDFVSHTLGANIVGDGSG